MKKLFLVLLASFMLSSCESNYCKLKSSFPETTKSVFDHSPAKNISAVSRTETVYGLNIGSRFLLEELFSVYEWEVVNTNKYGVYAHRNTGYDEIHFFSIDQLKSNTFKKIR